jgi:hypothetical protein
MNFSMIYRTSNYLDRNSSTSSEDGFPIYVITILQQAAALETPNEDMTPQKK